MATKDLVAATRGSSYSSYCSGQLIPDTRLVFFDQSRQWLTQCCDSYRQALESSQLGHRVEQQLCN